MDVDAQARLLIALPLSPSAMCTTSIAGGCGRAPGPAQKLLGTPDIQSPADIANSYQIIVNMRVIPVTPMIVLRLVLLTLVPFAPLLLTVVPMHELVPMILKALF